MAARRALKLTSILFFASWCQGQNVNPFAADGKAAETGRWTFRILCGPCHGIHADGGRGPDLTRGTYSVGDRDSDLYGAIARGVPGSEMPGYADRIDADAIWRLVTYIRSIARNETNNVPGDVSAGGKIFWGKGGCGKCHRAGSNGSSIGPDLSRAGRQRSLAYLRTSVLKPDADLTPGYGTLRVVRRDGTTISGVERSLDNFSAQLVDLSGKYYSFLRENVTSITREDRSLMPSYERVLTQSEVDDLLAYLISLRGVR
jgi:putative heme-binding domain-containing protein